MKSPLKYPQVPPCAVPLVEVNPLEKISGVAVPVPDAEGVTAFDTADSELLPVALLA